MRTCVVAAVVVLAGTAQACVPLYGQCGGMDYTGLKCCEKGSVCVVANPYYSQCVVPTPTAAPTTAKPTTIAPTVAATTAAPTKRVCSAIYAQCGGMNFTGPKCCQKPSVCVVGNPYYSQCLMTAPPTVAPTTAAPTTKAPTAAPTTAAPTAKPACSALYAQCGGKTWTGPTCCVAPATCKVQYNNGVKNEYYSQCL